MKKFICILLVFVMCFLLCSCSAGKPHGIYRSESGYYSVKFDKSGSCTWYQSGYSFFGTYEATADGWHLYLEGNSDYGDTDFYATKSGRNLIIEGGTVDGELFIKQ